jgi:hypothetical protein
MLLATWMGVAGLMSMAAGCTFDAPRGGTCQVENDRENGYVCRNGRWQPVEPDVSPPNPSTDPSDTSSLRDTSSSSPSSEDTSTPRTNSDADSATSDDGTSGAADAGGFEDAGPPSDVPNDDDDTSPPDPRDTGFDTTSPDTRDVPDPDTGTRDGGDDGGGGGDPECQTGTDCASGVCRNGRCRAPTCQDGIRNGSETSIDCGGDDCAGCPPGDSCNDDSDCKGSQNKCIQGTCELEQPKQCQNGSTRQTPGQSGCGYDNRGTSYDVCKNNKWKTAAECRDVWYRSCAEYMRAHPNAKRGRYELDPDGPGGPAPAETYLCSNNGWTRVAFDTFDNGNAPGWSDTRTSTCGRYGTILGGDDLFGYMNVEKTFQLPPIPHQLIQAQLIYIAIDNWESRGPQEDDAGMRINQTSGTGTTFSGTRGSQECGRGLPGWYESSKQLRQRISSSSDTITLYVGAQTTAGVDNESWGIDDVEIWIK